MLRSFLTLILAVHFADKASCCGIPDAQFPIKTPAESNQRIWRGAEARPHSLPWQVFMEIDRDLPGGERAEIICGGSIISPNWVVTSAACIQNSYGISLYAGLHKRQHAQSSHTIQVRRNPTVIQHPDYTDGNYDSDIALLQLDEPLEFNSYVQPVCVTRQDPLELQLSKSETCLTSGWGITETGHGSNPLKQAYVQIIGSFQCSRRYSIFNSKSMICVWDEVKSNISSCGGDSGGPLVCKSETGEWSLFGVSNFGTPCAVQNVTDKLRRPSVFTDVFKYRHWIQDPMANPADTNECESEPCQNNGVCTDKINGVTCQCTDGFIGNKCEISSTHSTQSTTSTQRTKRIQSPLGQEPGVRPKRPKTLPGIIGGVVGSVLAITGLVVAIVLVKYSNSGDEQHETKSLTDLTVTPSTELKQPRFDKCPKPSTKRALTDTP